MNMATIIIICVAIAAISLLPIYFAISEALDKKASRKRFEKLPIGAQFVYESTPGSPFTDGNFNVFVTEKAKSENGKKMFVRYKYENTGGYNCQEWQWFERMFKPTGLIVK